MGYISCDTKLHQASADKSFGGICMKKRLLALILAVVLVASCLSIGAAAITSNEGVNYAISLEGKKIDVDGNGHGALT